MASVNDLEGLLGVAKLCCSTTGRRQLSGGQFRGEQQQCVSRMFSVDTGGRCKGCEDAVCVLIKWDIEEGYGVDLPRLMGQERRFIAGGPAGG